MQSLARRTGDLDLIDVTKHYPLSPNPFSHKGRRGVRVLIEIQSPFPALGEGLRVRAINFCQSTRAYAFVQDLIAEETLRVVMRMAGTHQ